jgi:hypothetical protein
MGLPACRRLVEKLEAIKDNSKKAEEKMELIVRVVWRGVDLLSKLLDSTGGTRRH